MVKEVKEVKEPIISRRTPKCKKENTDEKVKEKVKEKEKEKGGIEEEFTKMFDLFDKTNKTLYQKVVALTLQLEIIKKGVGAGLKKE